jgi:hypothetical protein
MNKQFLAIENNTDYVKDPENGAILNTNLRMVQEYREKRKQATRVRALETEINMLKAELEKIKTHLNLS